MSEINVKERRELRLSGMSCNSCAARVKSALERVEGVRNATVQLESGHALVEGESIDPNRLVEAVTRAGYGVRSAG